MQNTARPGPLTSNPPAFSQRRGDDEKGAPWHGQC
jgi:hypothetical protein